MIKNNHKPGFKEIKEIERIRSYFPLLKRKINEHPLIYFDNAASAQKHRDVIKAMKTAMEYSYANVHRGLYTLSNEVTEQYEASRKKLAQFLNAGSSEEIVFTKNATEAINLVANGFLSLLNEGDEILITQMEHHSNIVPWYLLKEKLGIILKWCPVHEDGSLDMDAFEEALSPKTRLIAITHMSNVLGSINPIKRIVELAKACNAAVLVDGAQAVVHIPEIDVCDLGVDFYAMTGHKLYGPTGIGALYITKAWQDRFLPYQGGGEMIEDVFEDYINYADPPYKFEAGTPPILEVLGLNAALNWLMQEDRSFLVNHKDRLCKKLTNEFNSRKDVHILGKCHNKGPIISFVVDHIHPHDLAQILDQYGIALRAGHHCAQPLMKRYQYTSTLRVSFAPYNTEQEVDSFLEAFDKASAFFK